MAKVKKEAKGKKGRTKKVLLIVVAAILLLMAVLLVAGMRLLGFFNKGNDKSYNIENVQRLASSPLEGKKFIFLGSSVTDGMHSRGTSFVEYISKRNGCDYVKEAVSGTTLVDNGKKSYVQRLLSNIDKNIEADGLICQLSTNDAQKGLPMGAVSQSRRLEDFDTGTVIGAMEYIICYSGETWSCPVIFYTGTAFDNEQYAEMVDTLYELQDKWGIGIIDLWNEGSMQNIDSALYNEYMNDSIHPTKRGYLEWWTPVMEKYLYSFYGEA